jgi:hypothetical protein
MAFFLFAASLSLMQLYLQEKIPNEGRPVQICTRRQQKADALYQTVAELSGWGAVTIFRKHLQSIRWEFYGL